MNSIPARKDFGIEGDLDVDWAWKNFGGKSLEEASLLFQSNPFRYREDLMWMDAPAFTYYFPIAIRYLKSDASKDDCDVASCIASLLELRIEYAGAASMREIGGEIRSLCDYVVANFDRFDIDPNIYGDVKGKYEKIGRQYNSSLD